MREKYKKFFLAGFIEGEGSLCISLKKNASSKFGINVDPEFFIYQHKSGRALLEMAQQIFHTGTIYEKDGNRNVLVFAIRNRRSIKEKVIPFFEKYVMPFSQKFKNSFSIIKRIIELEERGAHQTKEGMIEILKLASSFKTLEGKRGKWDAKKLLENLLRDHTSDSE